MKIDSFWNLCVADFTLKANRNLIGGFGLVSKLNSASECREAKLLDVWKTFYRVYSAFFYAVLNEQRKHRLNLRKMRINEKRRRL